MTFQRIVLFSHGQRQFAPVRSFSTDAPAANLGPSRNGAPVAVYSRCHTRPFDCKLFTLGLRSGREHELRSLSTKRWSEDAVAVWGSRYVFRRMCGAVPSGCTGAGLFVSPPLRRISRAFIRQFDLHGRVAAFTRHFGRGEGVTNAIFVSHLSRRGPMRQCPVATARRLVASGLRHAHFFTSPVLTRRFVYWEAGPDTSAEEEGPSTFLRRRIPTRGCAPRGPVERMR
jgi:hypothetical protein